MQDRHKDNINEKLFIFQKNKVLADKQAQVQRNKLIERLKV